MAPPHLGCDGHAAAPATELRKSGPLRLRKNTGYDARRPQATRHEQPWPATRLVERAGRLAAARQQRPQRALPPGGAVRELAPSEADRAAQAAAGRRPCAAGGRAAALRREICAGAGAGWLRRCVQKAHGRATQRRRHLLSHDAAGAAARGGARAPRTCRRDRRRRGGGPHAKAQRGTRSRAARPALPGGRARRQLLPRALEPAARPRQAAADAPRAAEVREPRVPRACPHPSLQ
eukprot:1160709-Prymnesium_polylepis.1